MPRRQSVGTARPAAGRQADPGTSDARIPRATYRLQLHSGFGFEAARAVLPYLQRLGISDVYCSPIMRAHAGSQHGYDVVDPAEINPELGGEDGFLRLAEAAHALGLGLLVDQVPNHMGIFGADNRWWMDVLEHGPSSAYAGFFDIDWAPANKALHGKVLVPILGGAYGDELDHGAFQLALDASAGCLFLRYHEHRFPLDPRSYGEVLLRAAALAPAVGESAALLEQLAAAFGRLPDRSEPHLASSPRAAAAHRLQQGLAELATRVPAAAAALESAVDRYNEEPEHNALHALHDAQAFRLAHWRLAADEINYRRFFDVNALAALRIEDERVFEAVQGRALDMAAAGIIDGLRIDHPDGLLDPATFFHRLQEGYARRRAASTKAVAGAGDRPLYVVAEKIIAGHESMPRSWAVHGTTGYDFLVLANGVFVERRHAARLQGIWRAASGESAAFAETVHACKRMVAQDILAAQLAALAHALQQIALADRRTRDFGFDSLRNALAELAAAMPVYRTYGAGAASPQDRRYVAWAIAQAQRHSSTPDAALFEFLKGCVLGEISRESPMHEAVRQFAQRFQQFCAPLAAKGVEDTAFYRYHRLVSLCEVGGDPAHFGTTAAAFHAANRVRARDWPHTLLATSTHDNKRSEDVRNRINVLSEMPAAWRLAQRRWKTTTRAWRSTDGGVETPSPADQFLLHQTLLGTLPASGLMADDLPRYRERIEQCMRKSMREAKRHTSWALPNTGYEAAMEGLVRGILARVEGNPVLADLQARAEVLAWYGALNSLALTLLKLTCPGVPDFYQGTELMDLSLVDPDNRRPVDFALRERMLGELEKLHAEGAGQADLERLLRTPADGRLKLWLSWRLLSLRQRQPALFQDGSYLPLRVRGRRRGHLLAYARRSGGEAVVVLVSRKFAQLGRAVGEAPVGSDVWGDTQFEWPSWMPTAADVTDVLEGTRLKVGAPTQAVAEVFQRLPFAVLSVSL